MTQVKFYSDFVDLFTTVAPLCLCVSVFNVRFYDCINWVVNCNKWANVSNHCPNNYAQRFNPEIHFKTDRFCMCVKCLLLL